ncbi:CBS domain-containing protein [Evansella cellulosilytica]|uniref:CBS domain containing protein n=1 Tax=Evansella cellulosilytica (strain ATCC 21833 / DSM 2522 / FERM P-1141 / JCM 9156 / N-4) TaxID=649639 RepID=E6TQZ8_EVAC2|nr:CBS domain-containing protein [Evansella cellulosilytica]ADU29374.1 CBS domain containing protein [Evansella cellulosilytica DSM 2522]
MENADRFLEAFNRIDKLLRGILKISGDRHVDFVELVKKSSESNSIVRRFKEDLLLFSKLRNVIVHDKTQPNIFIAEPHETTVEKIKKIEMEIKDPKKVIPEYQRNVVIFNLDNTLTDVLLAVKEYGYSQFPVYHNEEFKGLLTENGITAFLAREVNEELIMLPERLVEEVLSLEESNTNYKFISREASIYEAKELFKSSVDTDRLDALLVTHSGKSTESLLGIITLWDVVQVS